MASTERDTFAADLARFGPGALGPTPSLAESRAYCAQLARRHYENFVVASWLVPRALRPHFFSVYAYCRWADDLGDETNSPQESLALLDWWQTQFDDLVTGGTPRHPVFIALAESIQEFQLPVDSFRELLVAFRQDQTRRDYATFEELLGYCRCSANPVGRLVLHLARSHDDQRGAWSDAICTGLQLANFWQDVRRDAAIGRIYLPRQTREQFGCDERPWLERRATVEFRRALEFEVERAETFFRAGEPLIEHVPSWLAGDLTMFLRGGRAVLAAIRRQQFDVWSRRPTVGKLPRLAWLLQAWWRGRRARRRESTP